MSDVLAAGSKRLAKAVDIDVSDEGCDWGPIHEVDPQSIFDDPGVKALVEACSFANDVFILHGAHRKELPGDMYVAYEKCNAALKLWRDGE